MWRGIFKRYPEIVALEQALVPKDDKTVVVNIRTPEQAAALAEFPHRSKWIVRLYAWHDGSDVEEHEGVAPTRKEALAAARAKSTEELEKFRMTDEEVAEWEAARQSGGNRMSLDDAVAMGAEGEPT